ncbi:MULTISPECIES: hypothetical protein [Sinorhizobium]|uniref:hypothetical protein n=1 Tax=Sinorhizobium TaxID=28105 RepID=UPI00192D728A|nr:MULTISPECIES: hypothetical protein [Sinorhizobium]
MGLLFGVLSTAFIISGIVISKSGLGKNPLRTLLLVNLITWSVCCVFTIQSSVWLLAGGCFIWMLLAPYAEAAEQPSCRKWCPWNARDASSALPSRSNRPLRR